MYTHRTIDPANRHALKRTVIDESLKELHFIALFPIGSATGYSV